MNDLKVTGRILPISDATKKLNPGLFAVGGVDAQKRQPLPGRALGSGAKIPAAGRKDVAIVVTLIACRKTIFDDDNLGTGFKPLRDAIARTIGIDDGDKRIRFECHQLKTSGRQGTIVRVEVEG